MCADFNDLVVWREAALLARAVSRACRDVRGPAARNTIEQLARAADSIPANIAEAHGRGVNRDGARFLRIARGSAAELESHLRIAAMTGRLAGAPAAAMVSHCRRVRYLLDRFLRSVEVRSR